MPNRVKSNIKPEYEFVTRDDKPDMIGIVPVATNHGAWYAKEHLVKYVKKLEIDLAFWNEFLGQFSNQG